MNYRVICASLILYSNSVLALDDSSMSAETIESDSHWWSGFTFTPGVGLRHLGLDVTRQSDGLSGNIAQSVAAKLFFSFSITSPSYDFNDHWGLTLRSYSSVVSLDSQFYSYDTTDPNTGANQGERIDVGTEVSGSYSYVVPTVHFKTAMPNGSFAVALGVGYWTSNLSGNIALTSNDKPTSATPKTPISLSTHDQLAYLFFMSYTTSGQWIYEMTVGGPSFSADGYDYKLEEVSLTVGKQFTL